jgi:hypothetical protein
VAQSFTEGTAGWINLVDTQLKKEPWTTVLWVGSMTLMRPSCSLCIVGSASSERVVPPDVVSYQIFAEDPEDRADGVDGTSSSCGSARTAAAITTASRSTSS